MQEIYLIDVIPFLYLEENTFKELVIKFHNYLLLNNIDMLTSCNVSIHLFTKNYNFIEELSKYNVHIDRDFNDFNDIVNIVSDNPNNSKFILFSNTIGISKDEIEKLNELLQYEENQIILGKNEEYISFLMTNAYTKDIFENVSVIPVLYDIIIQNLNLTNLKIEIINNQQLFFNENDINKLYQFLTTKENKKYCPDHIYEHFTNLFIELKELQK
ncbi:MAG TPA: hypothetical protein PLI27_00660 [Ignavibacteriales bacterium]|nr:hypothetical protein [Ignavibacteriales bacterium]HPP33465.1 hypothetical protein [Ignavibacteriales bacterium]HRR18379.1 hypothetical protein [Ignavibacteriales bacterium]HRT99142.1 hypothetical protein [Ignavibacteriales bacterium]